MASVPSASTVTIFGGSGFLGRHVVRRLAKTGAILRIACRHPSRAGHLLTAGDPGQIVPVAVDVTDLAAVAGVVAGADIVINLIGILFESGRWTFTTVQAETPGCIAAAAQAAGVERLIHVSAIGADPQSAAAYARTKAEGELAVFRAFPQATVLRPSLVVGPEDRFFNMFASMAVVSPTLPLIGGGETRFQPVYVGDVADAVSACLGNPATAGSTYELGGPKVYSFRALMELMLATIGRKRFLLPMPWGVAMAEASLLEKLPSPILTRDQVELLRHDNVVGRNALGFADLGLAPAAIETVIPRYLSRFRPQVVRTERSFRS